MSEGRIIVSGALANKHRHGGEAWVRLNWLLGFRALGFDVHFIEQIAGESCVDVRGESTSFATSANLAHFRSVTAEFGIEDRATLICDGGAEIFGLGKSGLADFARGTDLLVNISGHLTFPPVFERVKRRAYVDIDPGFTQFWHAAGNKGARLDGHDCFFTVGENIGAADCTIPTCGIEWRKTRPPVLLEHWPRAGVVGFDRFTTVASWRGAFGPVRFGDATFGLKVHEFRKFIELPRRTGHRFGIALDIHPSEEKDIAALRANGWQLDDPLRSAGTPCAFRTYIQNSSAEFSVAQGIYVQTNSGWFSDRTAHYLASGRPALVQETGFSPNIPCGAGLLAFRTFDEAVAGAAAITGDYQKHCRAARALAENVFDSRRVLRQFLDDSSAQPIPATHPCTTP